MSELTLLGQKVSRPVKKLEGFPAPPLVEQVCLQTDELTSVCPITGQPDFYQLTISYRPRELCLESKSLKLYLWTFRERGAFCEALAEEIAEDICQAISPKWVEVTLASTPRGGITIRATAARYRRSRGCGE